MSASPVRGWMKTTTPEKLKRVEEVLQIVIAGGQLPDLRSHSEAQQWFVSDSCLWQYKRLAMALLKKRFDRNRSNFLSKQTARLELILARALESGDLRVALDAVKDLGRLQCLYPPREQPAAQGTLNLQQNFFGMTPEAFNALPTERKLKLLRGDKEPAPVVMGSQEAPMAMESQEAALA